MEQYRPEGHRYLVYYKHPRDSVSRSGKLSIECRLKIYEGVCDNFCSIGSCVFSNEDGMLVVGFKDIIQMIPVGVE